MISSWGRLLSSASLHGRHHRNAVVPAVASACSMHAVPVVISLCMEATAYQRTKESQESAPSSRRLQDFIWYKLFVMLKYYLI